MGTERSRTILPIARCRGAFAIYLGIALTILLVVVGVQLVGKLLPASKNVKGIEQGNVAYYAAESAVERALATLSSENPGLESSGAFGSTSSTGYSFRVFASGTTVPLP